MINWSVKKIFYNSQSLTLMLLSSQHSQEDCSNKKQARNLPIIATFNLWQKMQMFLNPAAGFLIIYLIPLIGLIKASISVPLSFLSLFFIFFQTASCATHWYPRTRTNHLPFFTVLSLHFYLQNCKNSRSFNNYSVFFFQFSFS